MSGDRFDNYKFDFMLKKNIICLYVEIVCSHSLHTHRIKYSCIKYNTHLLLKSSSLRIDIV